jgi:hypothetical protein
MAVYSDNKFFEQSLDKERRTKQPTITYNFSSLFIVLPVIIASINMILAAGSVITTCLDLATRSGF